MIIGNYNKKVFSLINSYKNIPRNCLTLKLDLMLEICL